MNTITLIYTKMREKEKKELLKFFSRMNEQQRFEIASLKISIFRTTKEDFIEIGCNREEHDNASLIMAISKMLSDIKALERKGSLDKATLQRIEKFKKACAKKNSIRNSPTTDFVRRNLIIEISRLREEGLSWREIAEYVRVNHKKRVSHTLLRETYLAETFAEDDERDSTAELGGICE